MDALTIEDRVKLLKRGTIFAGTPDDVLSQVAELLEPVQVQAGETIFRKGDAGDCMYIVVQGRICIHDGDRVLDNSQGAGHVFGEMALLDEERRLADATALEDSQLLNLGGGPFYELMASRPEIARGLMRVLSQYLRACLRDMAQDFAYIQQMARLTAAAGALESGSYQADSVDEVAKRGDALGQLARVFRSMAAEVVARERRLRQEVRELRIEIDSVKTQSQLSFITESDYFQQLEQQVEQLRGKLHTP
jgi:CRP-like cAMP-binding protein